MTKYGENYTMTQEDLDIIATYVDDYMLEHTEIVDDLLFTLGGIMEW